MFPKSGRKFPNAALQSDEAYGARICKALNDELGSKGHATKAIMRWTGASDRTARNWLSGRVGPSGRHLLILAQECPAIWAAILDLSGHHEAALADDLHAVEVALAQANGALERLRRNRIKGMRPMGSQLPTA